MNLQQAIRACKSLDKDLEAALLHTHRGPCLYWKPSIQLVDAVAKLLGNRGWPVEGYKGWYVGIKEGPGLLTRIAAAIGATVVSIGDNPDEFAAVQVTEEEEECTIANDPNLRQEKHPRSYEFDEENEPVYVWINHTGDGNLFHINSCPHCTSNKYRECLCGCKKAVALDVCNVDTLINLYNALHEALVEKELK